MTIPITNNQGFSCLANSLEECGLSSIGSSNNENTELRELLLDGSSAARHNSSEVDATKRVPQVGWEGGEKRQVRRERNGNLTTDVTEIARACTGPRNDANATVQMDLGRCPVGHVFILAPSGHMISILNSS